eukprot:1194681-Prorocentrum_minimum.AAC.3
MGARYGYILSPLPRLVPATGIFSPPPQWVPDAGMFSLPFRNWCPLRVYSLSPSCTCRLSLTPHSLSMVVASCDGTRTECGVDLVGYAESGVDGVHPDAALEASPCQLT